MFTLTIQNQQEPIVIEDGRYEYIDTLATHYLKSDLSLDAFASGVTLDTGEGEPARPLTPHEIERIKHHVIERFLLETASTLERALDDNTNPRHVAIAVASYDPVVLDELDTDIDQELNHWVNDDYTGVEALRIMTGRH